MAFFMLLYKRLRQTCKADRSEKDDECSQPSTSQSPLKFIGGTFSLAFNWKLFLSWSFPVDDIEKYPPGWPQVAAFQNTNDSLLLFRSFNQLQCRTLQNLQSEISLLEKTLQDLDTLDSKSPELMYRLSCGKHEVGWDTSKKDIFRELETKFQTYSRSQVIDGLTCWDPTNAYRWSAAQMSWANEATKYPNKDLSKFL